MAPTIDGQALSARDGACYSRSEKRRRRVVASGIECMSQARDSSGVARRPGGGPATAAADERRARGEEGPTFAALDLGTNNCRLLIAKPAAGGGFRIVEAYSNIVRLGEGLSHSGRLADHAMDRALGALKICAEKIARRRCARVKAVATQACRSAANGEDFID